MPHDVVVDVIVPDAPVVDVASVGVQGPPGEPGPAGPPGEPGDAAGPHAVTHQTGGTDPITLLDASVLTGTVTTNVLAPLVTATTAVVIGAAPAQSGALRLGNNSILAARNAANTADVSIFHVYVDDRVYVGPNTANQWLVLRSGSGTSVLFESAVTFQRHQALSEIVAPSAPEANTANIWLQDNGSGKTQLMVQFATGAAIQIAIQP